MSYADGSFNVALADFCPICLGPSEKKNRGAASFSAESVGLIETPEWGE